MATQALKDLSIANSPAPTITPEGQAAKDRIAAARASKTAQEATPSSVGAQATPINRTDLTSLQSTPSIADVPTPPVNTDFSSIISRFKPQDRPELDVNRQQISELGSQMATRGARGAELDQAAGLDASYSRSAQLSEQIADLTGSFDMAIQDQEGFVRPQEFITGRQSFLQNQKAVRIEALSAAQAAVDGNIALAEQRIENALDREFGDIEAQLEAAKTDYTLNKDEYDRLDKAASEERAATIAERERVLGEQKEERKTVFNLMTEAASEGADAATISRIAQAQTQEEALTIAGSLIGRTARMQAAASIRSSNASAARAETGRLLDLAEAGDQNAISALGLTMPDNTLPSSDEIAYARQYASTGTIPAGLPSAGVEFGRIADLASDLPKAEGTLVDKNTNVASANISATDQASFDALYNAINTDLPAIQAAWDEINQRSSMTDDARALAEGEMPSESGFGTGLLGGIQSKISPTEAMTAYETSVADFTAKLVLARSGAAATDAEVARYQALLPGTFNTPLGIGTPGQQKLTALQTQMAAALGDKLSTNGLSIYGYSEIDLGGEAYKVGEIISDEYGRRGRVNPDGTITVLNN
jgi:hypothetical protein